MDKESLERAGSALDVFLENFAGCAVAPTRRLIATYVRGQLGPLARKSVKPMALEAGIPPRTLQELLSLHRWDENLLLAMLQRRVRRAHPGGSAVGLLFETRCVKKGDRTPGVERQTCESSPRARNCVVLLHLGLSDGTFHCLLDTEVYLPRAWVDDPERRRAARIPDDVRYRSKTQIAQELLRRAASSGLALSRLVAPAEYVPEAALSEGAGRDGRTIHSWPKGKAVVEPLVASALEARRDLDARMGDVGLDHFEVRSYRSLRRHMALSAASLLFLAEQSEAARRSAGSVPARSPA